MARVHVMSDVSLTDDGPDGAFSHKGLDYPLGHWAPSPERPYEVAPGVRWLRMPLPISLDHINLWLLDDRDENGPGTAIVDTGLNVPLCRDVWAALLPSIRVTRVIATHFHPDHIGLAGWLTERTGAPLWMTRTEYLLARTLQLDMRDVPPPEALAFALDAGWPEASVNLMQSRGWRLFAKATTPLPSGYRRMEDGERINIGGRVWQVVVGRGHSPEHACLLSEDGDLMISGDQVLPRISSNVSVSSIEPMGDPLGEWLASIERLKDLPDRLLVLPAHNAPFHGLHQRLDQLADEHRDRLEALHAFCASPRTIHECFPILFKRPIDDSVISAATGETLAHLRRLEVEGRVRRARHGTALRFGSV